MILYLTQMSFSRSAQDLTDEDLLQQIDWCVALAKGEVPKSQPVFHGWAGSQSAVMVLGMLLCMEWSFKRGYDDKKFWIFSRAATAMREAGEFYYLPPAWFRDKDVIRSHRSHLIRTNPQGYGDSWPGTPLNMPVLWPVVSREDRALYELKVAKEDLASLISGELMIPDSMSERIVNLP